MHVQHEQPPSRGDLALAALAEPAAHFESPFHVVWDTRLSHETRLGVLKRWLEMASADFSRERESSHLNTIRAIKDAMRAVTEMLRAG